MKFLLLEYNFFQMLIRVFEKSYEPTPKPTPKPREMVTVSYQTRMAIENERAKMFVAENARERLKYWPFKIEK